MKFLIIQTSFTGDVILATALPEKIHASFPDAEISMLVRKGNETLLSNHPFLKEVLIWNKKENKLNNLRKLIAVVKAKKYDVVINLQRFAGTGILTALSGAKEKLGYAKNPLSLFYTKRFSHTIGDGTHEIERNQSLISHLVDKTISKSRLYPSETDRQNILKYTTKKYITISPGSVWFTKTLPQYKWIELIQKYNREKPETIIYLLGSKTEFELGNDIINKSGSRNIKNLAGELSFLESTSLMTTAEMNYVNDSAPLHMASAINAPVTAVYCSTVPRFGFGPLSDISRIVETDLNLPCRPCGLHGYKSCPMTHFKCAHSIEINKIYYSEK
jgi:heptosyltransferase II